MARRIRKIICVVLLSLFVISMLAPAMAQSAAAKVSSSSAKIYKTASTSAKSAKIGKGTSVTVKAVSGKWAKVKVNGKTGYMPVKYLKAASSSSSKSKSSSSSTKRYTAYASRKTYVYSKASSSASRRSVAVNTKLYVVGKSGSYYKVQNSSGSATGYIKASCVSRSKVSTASAKAKSDTSWKSKVVKMDWFNGGSHVLEKGHYGYIYDIDTGITMRIKRMGGHYHADVEPATAADTAKLKRIAKGKFSWKSHAVILKAGGKYVASAINTLPHGDQTIRSNNYNGQFCLHTTNSLTHASSKVNSNHQSAINRAYRWAHKK